MATFETKLTGSGRSAIPGHLIDKFSPIFIFILAIVPRLAAISRYVTPDEPAWVLRSIRFREAILSADWANTLQSGHPGITATWLGSLGIQLQLWFQPESRAHLEWLNKLYWLSPDNGEAFKHLYQFLEPGRILILLANCLGLVIIFLLARRRFGPFAALAAGFLLALDPFLAGLSGLMHLDGLLATLMVMTIVQILPVIPLSKARQSAPADPVGWRTWAGAGITTALAILTKSPGLFLLVIVPVIWAWQSIKQGGTLSNRFQQIGLWLVTIILVVLLLLPAVWADPTRSFETISGLAGRLLVDSVRPVFFLGQSTLQPGSAFYPLALILRLSPLVTVGFISALVLLARRLTWQRPSDAPTNTLWLLIFCVSFTLFLNISAKRFDRYLLPTIYSLILVSGWGIAFIIRLLLRHRYMLWLAISLISCTALGIAYLVTSWPTPMTAFNWLAGGPATAYEVLPLDWGEGSSSAARLAAARASGGDHTLFTTNLPATAPFFPGAVRPLARLAAFGAEPGDYIIYQATDWQADPGAYPRKNDDIPIPEEMAGWPVVAAPRSNGLTRSVLLAVPAQGLPQPSPISDRQLDLSFDHKLSLSSVVVLPGSSPTQILISSLWRINQPADFQLQLELQDSQGQTWFNQEYPLLNAVDQPARFWLPGERQEVLHEIRLPVDLAPGNYSIHLSLYDFDGSRLGVFDSRDQFQGITAAIGSIDYEPFAQQPPVRVPIELNSGTELIGMNSLPDNVGNGEIMNLDLWWQVKETTSNDGQLALLLDGTVILPEGGLPDGLVGQTYHIKPGWRISEAQEDGIYPISVQLFGENAQELWEEPVELGVIRVVHRNRIFELPDGLDPLQVTLGQIGLLQQAKANSENGQIILDITWQASQPDGMDYTAFIHLINQDGEIVDQVDRPPTVPTNQWLPGQVIRDQFQLSSPGEGRYNLATGFYNPATGERVPLFDRDGSHYTDDAYQLDLLIP